MQANTSVALKEWAITIDELGKGTQIIIFRKGGIHEEGHKFKIVSNTFFLYPGFEHQDNSLLKYTYKDPNLKQLSSVTEPFAQVKYFAKLEESIEIHDENQLRELHNEHIWTEQFVMERYMWKKKQPLHMLLLRVYKLDNENSVPRLPEYKGCKSWIDLPVSLKEETGESVLTDKDFNNRVMAIKDKLGLTEEAIL